MKRPLDELPGQTVDDLAPPSVPEEEGEAIIEEVKPGDVEEVAELNEIAFTDVRKEIEDPASELEKNTDAFKDQHAAALNDTDRRLVDVPVFAATQARKETLERVQLIKDHDPLEYLDDPDLNSRIKTLDDSIAWLTKKIKEVRAQKPVDKQKVHEYVSDKLILMAQREKFKEALDLKNYVDQKVEETRKDIETKKYSLERLQHLLKTKQEVRDEINDGELTVNGVIYDQEIALLEATIDEKRKEQAAAAIERRLMTNAEEAARLQSPEYKAQVIEKARVRDEKFATYIEAKQALKQFSGIKGFFAKLHKGGKAERAAWHDFKITKSEYEEANAEFVGDNAARLLAFKDAAVDAELDAKLQELRGQKGLYEKSKELYLKGMKLLGDANLETLLAKWGVKLDNRLAKFLAKSLSVRNVAMGALFGVPAVATMAAGGAFGELVRRKIISVDLATAMGSTAGSVIRAGLTGGGAAMISYRLALWADRAWAEKRGFMGTLAPDKVPALEATELVDRLNTIAAQAQYDGKDPKEHPMYQLLQSEFTRRLQSEIKDRVSANATAEELADFVRDTSQKLDEELNDAVKRVSNKRFLYKTLAVAVGGAVAFFTGTAHVAAAEHTPGAHEDVKPPEGVNTPETPHEGAVTEAQGEETTPTPEGAPPEAPAAVEVAMVSPGAAEKIVVTPDGIAVPMPAGEAYAAETEMAAYERSDLETAYEPHADTTAEAAAEATGGTTEATGAAEVTKLQEITPPGAVLTPLTYTVERGDSIWKISAAGWHEKLGGRMNELSPGQQSYLIDALKDRVKAHPDEFGLSAAALRPGNSVDLSGALNDDTWVQEKFAAALKLSQKSETAALRGSEAAIETVEAAPADAPIHEADIARRARAASAEASARAAAHHADTELLRSGNAAEVMPRRAPAAATGTSVEATRAAGAAEATSFPKARPLPEWAKNLPEKDLNLRQAIDEEVTGRVRERATSADAALDHAVSQATVDDVEARMQNLAKTVDGGLPQDAVWYTSERLPIAVSGEAQVVMQKFGVTVQNGAVHFEHEPSHSVILDADLNGDGNPDAHSITIEAVNGNTIRVTTTDINGNTHSAQIEDGKLKGDDGAIRLTTEERTSAKEAAGGTETLAEPKGVAETATETLKSAEKTKPAIEKIKTAAAESASQHIDTFEFGKGQDTHGKIEFEYATDTGKITGYKLDGTFGYDSTLKGQALLNDNWWGTMLNRIGHRNFGLAKISIEMRTRNIAVLKGIGEEMEKHGLAGSAEAKFLENAVKDQMKKIEGVYGDVFKENLEKP